MESGAASVEAWWAPEGVTLLEPPAVCRLELSPEIAAFERVLETHLDGHDLSIPPLPVVPQRVLQLLRQKDCKFSEVADTVAEDQVLAAALLRVTNSPMYCGLQKITSLQMAVNRLGVKAVQTLMMHQSLQAAMFHGKGAGSALALTIWQRALASGVVTRKLAEFTRWDPEDAFLAGLLHDIGQVMVIRLLHSHSKFTGLELSDAEFDLVAHERHQQFGRLIAEAWRLPQEVTEIIAEHHSFPGEDDPFRKQRLTIQVSDMICSLLGYAAYQPYDLLESRMVHELGLQDEPKLVRALEVLPEEVALLVAEL
jgi:putative nucleotidyltransferase with HDIG domain